MLENSHYVAATLLRPLARQRGGMRVCRLLNSVFLSWGGSPKRVAKMRDGSRMLIDLRSHTEWFSYYSGEYEDPAVELVKQLVRVLRSDFVDVGANIGMYTVRIAPIMTGQQRAICFEPVPDNVLRIRTNVTLNGCGDRVVIFDYGLSNSDGVVNLVLREDFASGSTTGNASIAISEEADGKFKKIVVTVRRWDNVVKELCLNPSVTPIFKVDIEGHEDFFFDGARSYICQHLPIFFSEVNNWFYQQRGTSWSKAFSSNLPDTYLAAKIPRAIGEKLNWGNLDSFDEISSVENVIISPKAMCSVIDQILRQK